MKFSPRWLVLSLLVCGLRARGAEENLEVKRDLRPILVALIDESDRNFAGRIADKISADANAIYHNSKPVEGMPPCRELVGHIKGYDFYMADVTASESLVALKEAFWSMPQYASKAGKFELQPDPVASTPKKEVTVLLLNGRKVANYSHYLGEHEDLLMVGPLGGRPAGPVAAVAGPDEKTRTFTTGTQILIDKAGGNFEGMSQQVLRKTSDGETLYMAKVVPEMQADSDAQVIMTLGKKNIYMNSYDDEKQVAFAFAAFQALPENGPKGTYSVEPDPRLEKPTSTTYHLRYQGAIVADFIKFKTKPKAIFSFGFRDGVPLNFAPSGRTYSAATIEETKRMIHENTVCPGCRGSGREEVPSGYVYVGSGLPKMKTVACHYCDGTGHLEE